MLLIWLPRDARAALDLLGRPGLSALERSLAASVVMAAIKSCVARGPVSAHWASMLVAAIENVAPDLTEPNDFAASDGDE